MQMHSVDLENFLQCRHMGSAALGLMCCYLRQGGYVIASVSLSVCLSVCLCDINITQKVTDQFLRKF